MKNCYPDLNYAKKYRKFVIKRVVFIDKDVVEKEKKCDFEIASYVMFIYKIRYFTDGAMIGSKDFVGRYYLTFKGHTF